jgi:protein involved in polysaccharide export with SLBB domain
MKIFSFSVLLLFLAVCGAWAQAPLRPGDTIEIRISGVPVEETATYNGSYTIDDQGMINVPYINQVKISGFLPNQIQEMIQNRLIEEKIFTHPTITVLQSTVRFVDVAGEVKSPQRVGFTADMTLLSALNAAGWFTDFADQKHIRLVRENKTTLYNMKAIRNNPALDPKVLPGDKIVVPQSWW